MSLDHRCDRGAGTKLFKTKGNLNQMLTIPAEGEITVNYIYSFVIRPVKHRLWSFHTDDFERAEEVLKAANVQIVKEDELE